MLGLALFQPDIPQNTGAAIRLCRCLGVHLHIIHPTGFLWDPRKIRQSAMDYYDETAFTQWDCWEDFEQAISPARIVLLTTKASRPYTEVSFRSDDILMLGRESVGVPDYVHSRADEKVLIPLLPAFRSLNLVTAGSMVLGEAMRQTASFHHQE